MPQVLFIIGMVALLLAFVALVVTLMLFIRLKIPAVIGELTGQTATAEIARIRAEGISRQAKGRSLQSIIGQETGSGSFDLQKLGLQTSGVLGHKEDLTGRIEDRPGHGDSGDRGTVLLSPADNAIPAEPMTELLRPNAVPTEPMTELLQAYAVPPRGDSRTVPLSPTEPMTELLQPNAVPAEPMTELLGEDPRDGAGR